MLQRNGSLISRLILKRYGPKNLLDRLGEAYKYWQKYGRDSFIFYTEQEYDVAWYIFKFFYSLKIFLVCANFSLLKMMRIVCFCLTVNFLKVCPAGTAPSYDLYRLVYMSRNELKGYFCLKRSGLVKKF